MESTLSLAMADLKAEIAYFLGYPRGTAFGESAATTAQDNDISMCLDSGLRRFYFPPIVPGLTTSSYEWSFLKPTASVTLASGATSLLLPDDFGGLSGPITIYSTTQSQPWEIRDVGEGQIRELQAALPGATGRPLYVAVQPQKAMGIERGQKYKLLVYPESDASYTLQMAYQIIPNALTSAGPWVYGGTKHHETVLESCLWVAEERLDDQPDGPHRRAFFDFLAASITADRLVKAQTMGYMGDNSDARRVRSTAPWHWANAITYNGASL